MLFLSLSGRPSSFVYAYGVSEDTSKSHGSSPKGQDPGSLSVTVLVNMMKSSGKVFVATDKSAPISYTATNRDQ